MIADWHWATLDYRFICDIEFFVNFSKKLEKRHPNFLLKFYGDDD